MQRGSVLPWILFLIFAVIASVSIYYYANSLIPKTVINLDVKTTPAPAYQSQTTINSLGLKLEIPEGFKKVDETEKQYFKRANGDIRKNFNYYVQYNPPEFVDSFYILEKGNNNLDKSKISVVVFKNPDNFDGQKFYKEYWYYPFVWGDYTALKNKIEPENIELIGGKEGKSGIVDYREGKPKFIYLPLIGKNLMLQIQMPTIGNEIGKQILGSFKFE